MRKPSYMKRSTHGSTGVMRVSALNDMVYAGFDSRGHLYYIRKSDGKRFCQGSGVDFSKGIWCANVEWYRHMSGYMSTVKLMGR
jgi:hypothetical protein